VLEQGNLITYGAESPRVSCLLLGLGWGSPAKTMSFLPPFLLTCKNF